MKIVQPIKLALLYIGETHFVGHGCLTIYYYQDNKLKKFHTQKFVVLFGAWAHGTIYSPTLGGLRVHTKCLRYT